MNPNKICCKYHPDGILVEDHKAGDLVCTLCGLVVMERAIDFSNEWRSFADDTEDQCRVGQVEGVNYVEGSTSTAIQYSHDSRHLDEEGNQKYKNRNIIGPMERLMKSCNDQVRRIGDRLHANNQVQTIALSYIKRLAEVSVQRRKTNHEVLATAALFFAFKSLNVPRSIKEICDASGVSKKDIHKVTKRLKMACPQDTVANSASEYITRYVQPFDTLTNVQRMQLEKLAKTIADQARNHKAAASKSPISVAATSIYMASLMLKFSDITKAKVADSCMCSEVTITGLFKAFYLYRFELLPKLKFSEYFSLLRYLNDI